MRKRRALVPRPSARGVAKAADRLASLKTLRREREQEAQDVDRVWYRDPEFAARGQAGSWDDD
jgi:hypothetical protein